jgi:hypothetical protein
MLKEALLHNIVLLIRVPEQCCHGQVDVTIWEVPSSNLGPATNYPVSGFSLGTLVKWGRGMQQCSWLRHYATSQKVTGSIHDEVIGFFN